MANVNKAVMKIATSEMKGLNFVNSSPAVIAQFI